MEPFLTNTTSLFLTLLRVRRCEVVCDVGSCDGTHAKMFRRVRPRARVIAFEANPRNARSMETDVDLQGKGIELENVAVGNYDGLVDFQVITGPEDIHDVWCQISSTRIRTEANVSWWPSLLFTPLRIQMRRLDSVLCRESGRVALWIDVEGGTFDVLEGAGELLHRVQLVHAEVEPEEIYRGQKTERDVRELMERNDFELVAFSHAGGQRDVLFLRRSYPSAQWFLSLVVLLAMRTLYPAWRTLRRLRFPFRRLLGRAKEAPLPRAENRAI